MALHSLYVCWVVGVCVCVCVCVCVTWGGGGDDPLPAFIVYYGAGGRHECSLPLKLVPERQILQFFPSSVCQSTCILITERVFDTADILTSLWQPRTHAHCDRAFLRNPYTFSYTR